MRASGRIAPAASPTLDVVRIDARGGAVVAGKAPAGGDVVLRVDGEEVATAKADADGNFVSLFDVAVADAPRLLTLETRDAADVVTPAEDVIVVAPGAVPPVAPAPVDAPPRRTAAAAPGGVGDGGGTAPPVASDTTAASGPVGAGIARDAGTSGDAAADTVSPTGRTATAAQEPSAATPSPAGETAMGTQGPVATAPPTDPSTAEVTPSADASGATIAGTSRQTTETMQGTRGASAAAAPATAQPAADAGTAAPTVAAAGPSAPAHARAERAAVDVPTPAGTTSRAPAAVPAAPSAPDGGALPARVPASSRVAVEAASTPAAPVPSVPGPTPGRTGSTAATAAPDAGSPVLPVPATPGVVPGRPDGVVVAGAAAALAGAPAVASLPTVPAPPRAGPAPDRTDAPAAPPRLFRAGPGGVRALTATGPPEAAETLGIDAISYDAVGEVQLAGRAGPDAALRIYLDGRPVQSARVGADGAWTSRLPDVRTGVYTLRVDEVAPDGSVTARVETPFQRTAPEIAAAARRDGLSAITVQPGFTLWALSVGWFGEGVRYVQIFEANRDQIRDPDLIYPGQVFAMPDEAASD